MDIISYNDIISLFNEEWDFSYLTYEEMNEVLNFPIKIAPNHIEKFVEVQQEIPKDAIFLIVVKHTEDYDYSLTYKIKTVCTKNIPYIKMEPFWCNYKYAVVKAGLGQYAKNSLVYHPRFKFETHFTTLLLSNIVKDLPRRNPSNFNLLSQCNNCNDCYNACPVKAIHNQEGFTWIDMDKCDNFCFFGNNEHIPSIKYNHPLFKNLTAKEKSKINNYTDFHLMFPNETMTSYIIKDEIVEWYQFPTCRECTSQSRCSKYKGNYPYEWDAKLLQRSRVDA